MRGNYSHFSFHFFIDLILYFLLNLNFFFVKIEIQNQIIIYIKKLVQAIHRISQGQSTI